MVPPLCQESLPRPFTLEKVRGSTTATDSVSIPFRSGRRSHPGEHGMRLGTLRSVSIPFRSGRRSHDDCTQPGDGLHECQSPSDRGAVHTFELLFGDIIFHVCQSPSDRGAVHTGLPVVGVLSQSYGCQSPSDRGAVHTVYQDPITQQKPVSIPFRSGRRSHHRQRWPFTPAKQGSLEGLLEGVNPFRSGRRSHGALGSTDSYHREDCVNPLQIGAPFTHQHLDG